MSGEFITPAPWSAHRRVFDMAYRHDNQALMSLASVGGLMEYVGQALHYEQARDGSINPNIMAEQYDQSYREALQDYIHDQVEQSAQLGFRPLASHRRLEVMGSFAEQIILLPGLFELNNTAAVQQRRRLIGRQGIYGLAAEHMQTVLADYNEQFAAENEEEYEHSKGLLTELTILALLNHDQSEHLAATPATSDKDILRQTDLVVFGTKGQAESRPFVRNVQVKSNELNPDNNNLLPHVVLVGGIAIGNGHNSSRWQRQRHSQPFQTSQAIIREVTGKTWNKSERNTLRSISRGLVKQVSRGHAFAEKAGISLS